MQAFYQPLNYPGAANNSDDAPGLWVALADGAGSLQFSSGAEHLSQWSAFEAADEAFGITGALGCADKMCVGDVAQRYFQPAENFNMSIYPDGWQQPQARPPAPPHAQEEGLLLPGFRPAVPRAAGAFADGLAIKAPMPLTLRQQLPVQFLNVTSSSDKRWWSYVVDFGCNFQVRIDIQREPFGSTCRYHSSQRKTLDHLPRQAQDKQKLLLLGTKSPLQTGRAQC